MHTAPPFPTASVVDSSDGSTEVSIIVPTINEGANLPSLAQRVHSAMAGRAYELLVIDDASSDGTPAICSHLATKYPLSLHIREHPTEGLSGAVLHGFAHSRGDYLVVMDGDLQHPPECLPALLEPLQRDEADFVIGSRHVTYGAVAGGWGLPRRINSRMAALLAWPLAGAVNDPMSGFFALRRTTLKHADCLSPVGYKIGLELLCKCQFHRIHEIPITFGLRADGKSKLSFRQQSAYLHHLGRLYEFRYPLIASAVEFSARFAVATLFVLAIYLIARWLRADRLTAVAVAYAGVVLGTLGRRNLTARDYEFAAVTVGLEWLASVLAAFALSRARPGASAVTTVVLALVAAALTRLVCGLSFGRTLHARKHYRENAAGRGSMAA